MKPLLLVFIIGLATVAAHPAGPTKGFGRGGTLPDNSSASGRAAPCSENYAPCTCVDYGLGNEVICNQVPIANIVDVFFRTKTANLYSASLTVSATETVALPADLFAEKTIKELVISCPPVAPRLSLTIDPKTFEYTRRYTTYFNTQNCNFDVQDFNFLKDFILLETLRIENSAGLAVFGTLPAYNVTQLKELAVVNSVGLESATFPNLTPCRIEKLYLYGNQLGDTASSNILTAVAGSSSVSSLQLLSLIANDLTLAPQVASFSSLISLDLSSNKIPFIGESAFIFPTPSFSSLKLRNIGVTDIQGGAFQGSYAKATVDVENNALIELGEDVFKAMLQQMAMEPSTSSGQLLVTGNPFECGCKLAWLIRDHRNLLPYVKGGVCGGFFQFEDIDPNSFTNCP